MRSKPNLLGDLQNLQEGLTTESAVLQFFFLLGQRSSEKRYKESPRSIDTQFRGSPRMFFNNISVSLKGLSVEYEGWGCYISFDSFKELSRCYEKCWKSAAILLFAKIMYTLLHRENFRHCSNALRILQQVVMSFYHLNL